MGGVDHARFGVGENLSKGRVEHGIVGPKMQYTSAEVKNWTCGGIAFPVSDLLPMPLIFLHVESEVEVINGL